MDRTVWVLTLTLTGVLLALRWWGATILAGARDLIVVGRLWWTHRDHAAREELERLTEPLPADLGNWGISSVTGGHKVLPSPLSPGAGEVGPSARVPETDPPTDLGWLSIVDAVEASETAVGPVWMSPDDEADVYAGDDYRVPGPLTAAEALAVESAKGCLSLGTGADAVRALSWLQMAVRDTIEDHWLAGTFRTLQTVAA